MRRSLGRNRTVPPLIRIPRVEHDLSRKQWGQIAREIFSSVSRDEGIQRSLWLSAVVGAVVAVLALVRLGFRDGFFIALMFGYLAYISYAALQAYRGGGYGGYGGQDDRGW